MPDECVCPPDICLGANGGDDDECRACSILDPERDCLRAGGADD